MGIIQRQAFKNTIAGFLSTAIAAVSTLFIYPLTDQTFENYGYAQFVLMSAVFFSSFASFGTPALVVKFFSVLSAEEKDRKAYLFNMLLITSATFSIFLLMGFLLREPIYGLLGNLGFDVPLIRDNASLIISLTFVVLLISTISHHASNYHRIVVPEIFQNLIPKIVLPALILLFYFGVIDTTRFIHLFAASYLLVLLCLLGYLTYLGALDLKPRLIILKKKLLKSMASFAAYNGLGIVGNILANRIDVLMIATLLGKSETAYYTIALFIANIVFIPTKAITAIASPVISSAWTKGDTENIRSIYQKSSLNLLVIGIFLFFLIGGSMDSIFSFSANYEELLPAIPVFLWLGIAKLSDMGSSVNYQVIMYSRHYKVNLIFTILVGMLNTFLNSFLIMRMGVVGAAIATAISITTVNLMRMAFIQVRFGMLPFNRDSLKLFVLLAVALGIYLMMPGLESPFLTLLVYGLVLTIPYVLLVIYLRVSPDMLSLARTNLQWIRRLLP